jgi:hypothetical protein
LTSGQTRGGRNEKHFSALRPNRKRSCRRERTQFRLIRAQNSALTLLKSSINPLESCFIRQPPEPYFRDEFAVDSPLQRRVRCEPDFLTAPSAGGPAASCYRFWRPLELPFRRERVLRPNDPTIPILIRTLRKAGAAVTAATAAPALSQRPRWRRRQRG